MRTCVPAASASSKNGSAVPAATSRVRSETGSATLWPGARAVPPPSSTSCPYPPALTEQRRRHPAREPGRPRAVVVEGRDAFLQGGIHLVAKLVPREEVPGERGERDRNCERRRGRQREACPQAHGSRSA